MDEAPFSFLLVLMETFRRREKKDFTFAYWDVALVFYARKGRFCFRYARGMVVRPLDQCGRWYDFSFFIC